MQDPNSTQTATDAETEPTTLVDALDYVRARYDDSYGAQTEFSVDLSRYARENGMYHTQRSDTAIVHAAVRYPDMTEEAVIRFLSSKLGEQAAARSVRTLVRFAASAASRYGGDADDGTDTDANGELLADGGEETHPHPAAELETVIIDPDDVLDMLRRNRRRDDGRTHTLRVSPPFKGGKRATHHVRQEGAHYPAEMEPKPLHLNARTLLGDDTGRIPDSCQYPSRLDQRSMFREEYDLHPDDDVTEHKEWDEWWGLVVEVWEDSVRDHLEARDEITIRPRNPEVEPTTFALELDG